MGMRFEWDDEEKTVIRYVAEGDWNWTDFHRSVRVALFALHNLGHPVDTILDLSQSTKTPGGAIAHIRSVGKPQNEYISGRAIVIGLDSQTETNLLAGQPDRALSFGEQTIHFVDDEQQAQALLEKWR